MSTEIKDRPWWQVLGGPTFSDVFDYTWASTALAYQALNGAPHMTDINHSASLKEGQTIIDIVDSFAKTFPEWFCIDSTYRKKNLSSGFDCTFAHKNGSIKLFFDGDIQVSVRTYSNDIKYVEAFEAWWDENTNKEKPVGRVHVMVASQKGLNFKSIGVGGLELERGNYTDEVLRGYDRIIKDLNATTPAGRIAILDGSPGTGKTYLVRGILNDVHNAIKVIVPANLVASLGQPGTIPALVELHKNNGSSPMVFIIEDADECLAPRMGDNMSAVSTILNLGDGILGQLLDIRIVATTNQHRAELDDAILRPGRLSASVEVAALPRQKAKEVFERLAPGKEFPSGSSFTLAEVYQKARDSGWEPAKIEKRKMGFSHDAGDDEDIIAGLFSDDE